MAVLFERGNLFFFIGVEIIEKSSIVLAREPFGVGKLEIYVFGGR